MRWLDTALHLSGCNNGLPAHWAKRCSKRNYKVKRPHLNTTNKTRAARLRGTLHSLNWDRGIHGRQNHGTLKGARRYRAAASGTPLTCGAFWQEDGMANTIIPLPSLRRA